MTGATGYSQIRCDVAEGIATITLNRPDRLNAFTATMARELVAAFDATDADDDVRVVIVTGAGRGFCAGADLGRGAATFDATDETRAAERAGFGTIDGVARDGGGYVSLRVAASRKPMIAAINGPAVGVGATLTLPMDIRLAAESARFGFVFTRRGLVPETASSWFLPRVVGISQAMEWVATGRVFDAVGRSPARFGGDRPARPGPGRRGGRHRVPGEAGAAVPRPGRRLPRCRTGLAGRAILSRSSAAVRPLDRE
ncbi:hypothetical protein PA7_43190 [Pseudonocardia asaccharolytica DSM 44247 = NBRC 16224]|uniref:Enoyl-CoA hydratase n=1 Tax=Pseudonocardia asaccharolytica DSM 44247 = NBRC 16224 TaxID=1123024 RepID=A0A511D6U4_9PSEU|nr:hypothetical protein PA7_43190 [Pseudonocardia asaccharolytica DSM 44247 = NBRC 16224]